MQTHYMTKNSEALLAPVKGRSSVNMEKTCQQDKCVTADILADGIEDLVNRRIDQRGRSASAGTLSNNM